jgi:soluble lytic murein transglycosylase-like protein
MDGTWSEEAPKAGHADASAFDADAAIDVGAAYMASLRRFWRAAVDPDRHRLAQGSYNAGPGSIRSASRLCGGALTWSVVITCLPAVTGSHAAETINYVDRIAIWQRQLGNVR